MIRFCFFLLLSLFIVSGMPNNCINAQEAAKKDGNQTLTNDDSNAVIDLKLQSSEEKKNNIVPIQDLKGGVQKIEDEPEKQSALKSWVSGDHATGDWNGLRGKLEEHGVTLEVNYTNDSFLKMRGGLNNKTRLRPISLVDYGVTFDTEKLKLFPGGKIFILGQNIHGQGLTTNQVGDIQTLSSIDAPPLTQLGEYWYEQILLNNKIRVKLGKQDANSDFDALESSADFVGSSFTLIPTIPMPTYPCQGLGGAAFIEPVSWFNLKAGFFDGAADNRGLGMKSFFDGNDGYVTLVEAGIKPVIKKHPGNYILGYWHHSGDFDEITNSPNVRTFNSNNGLYATFEQMLYKENKNEEDNQGLNIQGQFGWSPSDRSEIARYYGVGLSYKGLIPKRTEDVTGFGLALANLSSRTKRIDSKKDETVLEFFHKIQLTPFFALQPDIQFIFNPGGNNKDSFVIGIRSVLNF